MVFSANDTKKLRSKDEQVEVNNHKSGPTIMISDYEDRPLPGSMTVSKATAATGKGAFSGLRLNRSGSIGGRDKNNPGSRCSTPTGGSTPTSGVGSRCATPTGAFGGSRSSVQGERERGRRGLSLTRLTNRGAATSVEGGDGAGNSVAGRLGFGRGRSMSKTRSSPATTTPTSTTAAQKRQNAALKITLAADQNDPGATVGEDVGVGNKNDAKTVHNEGKDRIGVDSGPIHTGMLRRGAKSPSTGMLTATATATTPLSPAGVNALPPKSPVSRYHAGRASPGHHHYGRASPTPYGRASPAFGSGRGGFVTTTASGTYMGTPTSSSVGGEDVIAAASTDSIGGGRSRFTSRSSSCPSLRSKPYALKRADTPPMTFDVRSNRSRPSKHVLRTLESITEEQQRGVQSPVGGRNPTNLSNNHNKLNTNHHETATAGSSSSSASSSSSSRQCPNAATNGTSAAPAFASTRSLTDKIAKSVSKASLGMMDHFSNNNGTAKSESSNSTNDVGNNENIVVEGGEEAQQPEDGVNNDDGGADDVQDDEDNFVGDIDRQYSLTNSTFFTNVVQCIPERAFTCGGLYTVGSMR